MKHELIELVEHSDVHKAWMAEHPAAYLVHIFSMEKAGQNDDQAGYYDPKGATITTFTHRLKVALTGSDKSFQETQAPLTKLDMTKVEVDKDAAIEKASVILAQHYSAHVITQKICILQHLDVQLWNLTLISSSFSMINIRVDAQTGEIISHEIRSLMDLGRKE